MCQTAIAQPSATDTDAPISSLEEAVSGADSDSTLVDLAVSLQRARADTEISFHEYREGVRLFQQHHPGFYGNFFGDPFYATYDNRYHNLTWKRQFATSTIDPQNGFRKNTWFFCWPSPYDPAFGGDCRGLKFAASDFRFLPSGPAFAEGRIPQDHLREQGHGPRRQLRTHSTRPSSRTPDTSGRTSPNLPPPDDTDHEALTARASGTSPPRDPEEGVDPVSTTDAIDVPNEVSTRMQREASLLRQKEVRIHVRRTIEEKFGDLDNLTPRERARITSELADRHGRSYDHSAQSSRSYDVVERVERVRDRIETLHRRHDRSGHADRDYSRQERVSFPDRPTPQDPDVDRPSDNDNESSGPSTNRPSPTNTSTGDKVEREMSDDSDAQ